MKLEILISGLKNPQPAVRLDVVRVLGMLDEVLALEALRAHYQVETDPAVKQAVAWAGKRLYEAQQAGYSTLNEIFRHFNIDKEIENTPDEKEAELMKKMQQNFDADMARMKTNATTKQVGLAAVAGLGTSLVAGSTAGLGAFGAGLVSGPSSSLDPRPQLGLQRTPATAPSQADITIWARRLRESAVPGQREQAAIELAQLNNPAALPHLAAAFVNDSAPQVRQAAQRFGKVLYWSMVYWEMEQDGSLAQEMSKRLAEFRAKTAPNISADTATSATSTTALPDGISSPNPPPPSTPKQDVDVSAILRQAQKAREQRQRKK